MYIYTYIYCYIRAREYYCELRNIRPEVDFVTPVAAVYPY